MSKKWFNKELNNLIYNKEWKEKAKRKRQVVFEFVDELPFVKRKFTSGSFGRKTNLPSSDIDIFVEIDDPKEFDNDIHQAQDELYAEVQRKWPENPIRPQPHTIGVILDEVKFELVPAFRTKNQGEYKIPEGENSIYTKPYEIKNRVKKVNGNTYGLFSHFTRIVKFWKKQNSVPLPSFYLELIILEEMERGLPPIKRSPVLFGNFFIKKILPKIREGKSPHLYNGVLSLTNQEHKDLTRKLKMAEKNLKSYMEYNKNMKHNKIDYLKCFFAVK